MTDARAVTPEKVAELLEWLGPFTPEVEDMMRAWVLRGPTWMEAGLVIERMAERERAPRWFLVGMYPGWEVSFQTFDRSRVSRHYVTENGPDAPSAIISAAIAAMEASK